MTPTWLDNAVIFFGTLFAMGAFILAVASNGGVA